MSAYSEIFEGGPRPVTDKQVAYARAIAGRTGARLEGEVLRDRAKLSAWIERHRAYEAYPSARQVAFAERIARIKRREIPAECFRDRVRMSRWIDGNKP